MESQRASKELLYIAKIFILLPCQHRVRMRMREAQLVGFASCFLLSAAGGERDNRENNMHRFGQRRRFLLDSCFFIFSPLYRDHSAVLSPAVPKFGSVRSFFRRARISCIISFFCLFGAGCCWSAGAAPFAPSSSSSSSSSSSPPKSPSSKSSSSLSLYCRTERAPRCPAPPRQRFRRLRAHPHLPSPHRASSRRRGWRVPWGGQGMRKLA